MERGKDWVDRYLATWGFLPICGGSQNQEELDDEDDDDDGDDDGDDNSDKPKSGRKFTEDDVNRKASQIVRDRMRGMKANLRKEIKDEVTRELQSKKATDDKDLAGQLKIAQDELAELRVYKNAVLKYEELAEKRFEDTIDTLPEHIASMAPDDDANPLEKEEWLTKRALPAAAKFLLKQKKKRDDDEDEDAEEEDDSAASKNKAKRGNDGIKPKPRRSTRSDEERLAALRKHLSRSSSYDPM